MRFKNSFINRLVFKYELAMCKTRFLILTIYLFTLLLDVKFLTLTCNKRYFFLLVNKDFIVIFIIIYLIGLFHLNISFYAFEYEFFTRWFVFYGVITLTYRPYGCFSFLSQSFL